jgi:hypothetical protein
MIAITMMSSTSEKPLLFFFIIISPLNYEIKLFISQTLLPFYKSD